MEKEVERLDHMDEPQAEFLDPGELNEVYWENVSNFDSAHSISIPYLYQEVDATAAELHRVLIS